MRGGVFAFAPRGEASAWSGLGPVGGFVGRERDPRGCAWSTGASSVERFGADRLLSVPSVFDPEWDSRQDRPPFVWRRARLGRQAGSEKLGASLYELEPGAASYPLHVHYANEELIVVLSGRPTLRTLQGERTLEPGEVVACRRGRAGAHRLDNRQGEAARVLVISTMLAPELSEYPDSGKFGIRSYAPGAEAGEGSVNLVVRSTDGLDYFDGEL